MILQKAYGAIEMAYDGISNTIAKNKKGAFILASLLTIAIAFLLSYSSRHGLNWMQAAGTSLFCILAYFSMLNSSKNYKRAILYTFLISGLFQFYLAWQFIGVEHDINNQMNAATAIEEGTNIYTDVQSFYTKEPIHTDIEPLYEKEDFEGKKVPGDYYAGPVWAYISFLMLKLTTLLNANFSTIIHFPMIIATLIIGFLLYRIMRHQRRSDRETYTTVALYLLNPVVMMVSGYHGQVDNLGIVFLVLYVYLLLKLNRINFLHNTLLGFSLVVKAVAAPLMPFFAAKQKKLPKMILFGVAVSLPYLFFLLTYPNADLKTKLGVIVPYGGVKHLWGYSRIEQYLAVTFNLQSMHEMFVYIYAAVTILMFAALFFYFLRNERIGYMDGIILSNLFFFSVSSGFGIQYFLWAIPFLALKANEKKFRKIFSAFIFLSSIMALLFYYGNANRYYFIRDAVSYSIIGILLWIFTVFWLAWFLKTGIKIKTKNTIQ